MIQKMKKSKGFTLIEMLVVIAIIAVLVSIIVPTVSNSTIKAKAAANAANLRSAAASITIDVLEEKSGLSINSSTGVIDGYTITAPTEKTITGFTGGTFKATLKNGEVVCTFGDSGTIDAYSKIAESGTVPSTSGGGGDNSQSDGDDEDGE